MSNRVTGLPPLEAGQRIRIVHKGHVFKEGLLAHNPFGSKKPYFELGGVMAYRFEDGIFLMPNVKYKIEIENIVQVFFVTPARVVVNELEINFELTNATVEQITFRAMEEFVRKYGRRSEDQFLYETNITSTNDSHSVRIVCFQNPDYEG